MGKGCELTMPRRKRMVYLESDEIHWGTLTHFFRGTASKNEDVFMIYTDTRLAAGGLVGLGVDGKFVGAVF
jgi:hypothetical protein